MELIAFVLVSTGLIIVPGPNVLIVVSTSISHGVLRGWQTVAGTSSAMAIQLLVAGLGTAGLLALLAEGFVWFKWLGVVYLLYLGLTHLFRSADAAPRQASAIGSFQRGFWISLTNPKTILFFSAFLPQFVVGTSNYGAQIAFLSCIFWVLATVLDSGYALLAHRLSSLLKSRNLSRHQNRASGLIYLGAGATLAAANRGQ